MKYKIVISGLVEADNEEEATKVAEKLAYRAERGDGRTVGYTFRVVSVEEMKEEPT